MIANKERFQRLTGDFHLLASTNLGGIYEDRGGIYFTKTPQALRKEVFNACKRAVPQLSTLLSR